MVAPPQIVAGHVFGRDFQIVQPLATGGMGAVYVALQLSTGKRRALKVMLSALVQDPRARERFAQEARVASRIDSEHVVETIAAGIDERTGLPWLAMELLEGRDLAQLLRERGPAPPGDAYEILQQIGEGLGAAHASGIVHRDLKPENLFIATSRRRGVPFTLKILDFGIAKLTQESRQTAATAAVGSPLWMAPEQTEQHRTIAPATDVWALGLIAFHLITGRFYWRVANAPEMSFTGLLTELLVLPIEPASLRAAQLGVGHLVPAGFDAWFARCVDRDPHRRFVDARAAAAALSPGLSMRETGAVVPMTLEHPRRLLPPTVAMGPSASHVPSATPYPPQHSTPHPSGPHAPVHASPLPARPPIAHQTPYAVHSPSTATGPVAARRSSNTLLIAAALMAALIGAGLSAFGGLALWQRLASRSVPEAPPPPRELVAVDAAMPAPLTPSVIALDAGRPSEPMMLPVTPTTPATPSTPALPSIPAIPPTPTETPSVPTETPAPAFAWDDGTQQRWRGTWSGSGWRYAIVARLRRDGREVSGTLEWRLLESPSPDFQARIGHQAEELVAGTFTEATGELYLRGYRTSDPTLISPDEYDLRVAPSGALAGRSHSDGGTLTARPAS